MSRKSGVSWYDSRSRRGYYSWIEGVQNYLGPGPDDRPAGPNYRKACEKLHRLLTDQAAELLGSQNPVGLVLARYLQHVEETRSPGTLRIRQNSFRAFGAELGAVPVAKLRHSDVRSFVKRRKAGASLADGTPQKPWEDGTVRIFLAGVQAAFTWAALPGNSLIPNNPLDGYQLPATRSDSRVSLISPEEHGKLCKIARPATRRLLICLENTGARPGELVAAEARYWDDALGALIYPPEETRREDEFAHKSARLKERIILFTGEALAVMRGLVAKYPSGPLLRLQNGSPWTPHQVVVRFIRMRKRLGNPHLSAKCYRHTLATNWLKAGKSIDKLAAILGNTANVIRKHYAHLLGDRQDLRAELERFRESQGQPASPAPCLRVIG